MPSTPVLLELDHVCRRLGSRTVLRDVSFDLRQGEVLGLLGVNGAGKSTTLAVIAGVLTPDKGRVAIHGRDAGDPRCRREDIGWVPENVPLWPELTVAEALDACGRLRGMPHAARGAAIERELARLELAPLAHRLCGRLSLGQKRRVGLAQALLHEPALLVFDEPGNGLDPVQTAQLRVLLRALARDHGIILSSHDLAEVEATCTRVVVLHEGSVRLDAPVDARGGVLAARFDAIARPSAGVAA